jgi:8-oxo-dGTP pyrophosphatase MutT (NUDIX family)
MYKVFIENREVNFSQANIGFEGISPKIDQVKTYEKWLLPLILRSKEGSIINVICEDLETEIAIFFKDHKPISAAGGIVVRKDELLFIRRHGLWDLPKGKIEKNERIEQAAIREVEEECGIHGVKIKEHLIDTFHTYENKGKRYLKRTYWFRMAYNGSKDTIPQTEEGITEASWVDEDDLRIVFNETYPSIVQVIKKFQEFSEK